MAAVKKNIAFFDFDGTLYLKDSFTGFVFYVLGRRYVLKKGVFLLPWINKYYLGLYSPPDMRKLLFKAMFAQQKEAHVSQAGAQYAISLLADLDPKLLAQLRQHQALGHDVVLVSASLNIYLTPLAELLKMQLICTDVEVSKGLFTGHYATADCSGIEKKKRILQAYNLSDYDVIYAYGNSFEDQEMLALADCAYLVGRDTKLPILVTEPVLEV
ncbi:HAD-IB family hydrolase [Acinetobacter apis]|uniref:HAD-superfamily subfamily IB hydrolase, TIGR01490 n=1 Tax=Acinetobacter apis TaxID=1229165 RepID=A0A217EEN9_9GAMM|nr:HAD-IB family phosphatase [Acinetobacter apis]SNQ28680.1 HAD-superfamily subfamily IB hydrolase, TIGR01490 [Acinetobacter apis]